MNGKSEADPNNDVKPKNDLEEENAVKVKLPSCLSYEGKRHNNIIITAMYRVAAQIRRKNIFL